MYSFYWKLKKHSPYNRFWFHISKTLEGWVCVSKALLKRTSNGQKTRLVEKNSETSLNLPMPYYMVSKMKSQLPWRDKKLMNWPRILRQKKKRTRKRKKRQPDYGFNMGESIGSTFLLWFL